MLKRLLYGRRDSPCEAASDEALHNAVYSVAVSPYWRDSAWDLSRFTHPISPETIPWDSIHALVVIGRANLRCNQCLKKAGLKPGIYVNRDGTWLLLIHAKEASLQTYADRCGIRLKRLMLCNTSLSGYNLTSLSSLEELFFHENENLSMITGLEQLVELTKLEFLRCDSLIQLPSLDNLSKLTNLRFYQCRNLTQLPSLSNLPSLTKLSISYCSRLTLLPSLGNLPNLTELDLSNCINLIYLPDLANLTNLTRLSLYECKRLTQLPSLGNLTKLTRLTFFGCGIRKLPEEIRRMKSLRELDLRKLTLDTLPDWLPEITEYFSLGEIGLGPHKHKALVCLYGTTVEDMPDMSIFEQPYEVVAKWFESRSRGDTRLLNEIKVVFLGDGEAGKSHTIARLMNDGGAPVDYTDQSTPGIVIRHRNYPLDDRQFRVHYWDFGGQEIMHSMHRIFLTNRTMYVVLLNARDDTQGDRAHYWLQNIRSFAPDAPVLLVLNKIDQNPRASVDERTLRSRYPQLKQILRLSARDFDRERFNREFTDILLDEIRRSGCLDAQWPQSWIDVKGRLENMTTHYILGDEYQQICRECQVSDVQTELLHWFNDLGVSFCFCDKEDYALKKHVILRPDWITNGLYIILFNECAGANNGQLPHEAIYDLLERAHKDDAIRCTLPGARYDQPGDVEYVLGVMRKFQLSLDTGDRKEFIPMLCQQDSTVDIHDYEQDADTLEFNMNFEYLPDNLLHRLMVERHAELDMANVWRKGAEFRLRELGLSAVVVIDGDQLRFFIRHTNSIHRPNTYLTMLKANVDRIVEKMGLKPPTGQLIYKLDGKQDAFDYEMLKAMQEAGETQIFSMTWRRKLLIQDILNQSAPESLEDERKLLDAIRESCGKIQDEPLYRLRKNSDGRGYENGQGMEDLRNRRIRDDLFTILRDKGYRVYDQTQIGSSGSGKIVGELDLLIRRENNEPWTIIEALRIHDGTKDDWNSHLDKLIDNYNARGLPRLYLLTYVDADPPAFARIWKGYQSHIRKYSPGQYDCTPGSWADLNDPGSPLYIKTAKCEYTCGGEAITVYHIFARIPTQNG